MQRRQQTITGRIFIQENNMTGLLTAKARADFPHTLQHITVTDLGFFDVDLFFLAKQKQTKVTHDSRHDRVLFQLAHVAHMCTYNRHDLITIHDVAQFIHCQQTVCIAVKRQTDVCLFVNNAGLQLFHMG